MILPTRWRDVPPHARVIDPVGVIWHVLPPALPGLPVVTVRGQAGETRTMPIDHNAFVPMLYESEDIAVTNLTACFDLDYLGG